MRAGRPLMSSGARKPLAALRKYADHKCHVRLKTGTTFVSGGFATTAYGETNDENHSTERGHYPFRCHRYPSVLPGSSQSGKPQGRGSAALAASHPGLHSRSRFRAVPGTAHALEPGKGPIEGGRPGAIAQAVWKLGPKGRRLWRSSRAAIRLGGLAYPAGSFCATRCLLSPRVTD